MVVGIDGSETSFDALRFAIEQARVNGAKVMAATASQLPTEAFGGLIPKVTDLDVYQSRALAALSGTWRKYGRQMPA